MAGPEAAARRDAAGDGRVVVASDNSDSPETGEGPAPTVKHDVVQL